ncbi:MAG: hypothetical protein RLY20_1154, partial [Verrucomicrobiota bacterium]
MKQIILRRAALILAVALTGCATTQSGSNTGSSAKPASTSGQPEAPAQPVTPEQPTKPAQPTTAPKSAKQTAAERKAAEEAARSKVLYQYRDAAKAMREGRYSDAKATLDDALLTIGNIFGKSQDAKRARSYFSPEAKKTFVGEPYERVMANYYRGILYWMDGEPDNARACFKTCQYEDSDAVESTYKGDYVLADYLDGLASVKLAADGADALARARASFKSSNSPPDYNVKENVLVFWEAGNGPVKYSTGKYHEELRFRSGRSDAAKVRVSAGEQSITSPFYDDLTFQATTRGGRVMDHVLANKAVFKGTANTVGNASLATGAVLAGNRNTGEAGLALMAFGLLAKATSAATTPAADIRCWDNLPNVLGYASLALPAGAQTLKVEFL